MSRHIELVFPIRAIPKGRPRATRSGHIYTPQKTRDYEQMVCELLCEQYKDRPVDGPIRVAIAFLFKRPKKSAHSYPSKGDVDNFAKAVLDACNGVLFRDDSQIVELLVSKAFSEFDSIALKLEPL